MDIEENIWWDDHRVWALLTAQRDSVLAGRLLNCQHFRVAFETDDHPSPEELERFDWLREHVIAEFERTMCVLTKLPRAPYSYERPPSFVLCRNEHVPLKQKSALVRQLKRIEKCRVYAEPALRNKIELLCANFWRKRENAGGVAQYVNTRLRRLGAVAWAVYIGNREGVNVAHTLLQKLFYFLQCAKGVDLGYRYRLYHYGPYCEDVWADLSYLEDIEAVTVEANHSGFGYRICPKDAIQTVLHFADEQTKTAIGKLLDFLGHRPVRELECLATTHYVFKELTGNKHAGPIHEHRIDNVRRIMLGLKPHLSEIVVRKALQELAAEELL